MTSGLGLAFLGVFRFISIVVGERFVDIGAVSHLVQDRFAVGPEPGERPENPAEREGEQAEALDRARLRMHFLVRDFLRQNVDEPEDYDADDRGDDDNNPGNPVRDRVERLTVEQRGVDGRGQDQMREREEKDEASAAATGAARSGSAR